jgi:hemoglobin
MTREIKSLNEIRLLVDAFYSKVKVDDVLGGIFSGVIGNKWPEHMNKMYSFWQTILLGEHTYSGHAYAPHADMSLKAEHFNRWIGLFTETVDELFTGEVAEEAKARAGMIAQVFRAKKNV